MVLEPHKRLTALAGPPGRVPTLCTMPAGPKARPIAARALLTLVPEALNQLLLRGLFLRRTRYTSFDQGLRLLGPGLGVLPAPPGLFLYLTSIFYLTVDLLSTIYGIILLEDGKNKSMEVDAMRLRELRERQALSLRELSELSGVNYNSIWRIEAGRTGAKPRTVRRLASALGVEPYELLIQGEGNG
jgi:HTH-type transcriptional regulator, competence development regulator